MSKSLTLGVVAVLSAVTACGADAAKPGAVPNFVFPTPTNTDAGMDSSVLPGFDGSSLGDGDFTPGDGDGDNSLPGPDAGHPADGSTTGDASHGDAAVESDAASDDDAGSDAGSTDAGGHPSDAGATDAGGGGNDADAGSSCGTSGLVAGNDCIGVVTCQDNNGTAVNACDVGGGAQHCCINTDVFGTGSNSCRSTACGNTLKEASCDGPEDCGGGAALCCFNGGTTSCSSTCSSNGSRLCHDDSDCAGTNKKCVKGTSTTFGVAGKWWGFCRGN
jgi:hypothetical protein